MFGPVPVVRIKYDNPEGFCEINESDFDKARHQLYEAAHDSPDTNGDGKVTAAEIKAALTAAGVPFKSNASKGDLVALHNAFERSGLTGAEWNNLADEDRANRVSY